MIPEFIYAIPIRRIPDASAASGGHVVFASSPARMKLVENNRLAGDALVDDESTASPFIIAQGVTSSPVAILLTVFLPSQPPGNGTR